jgi:hypothetical protein
MVPIATPISIMKAKPAGQSAFRGDLEVLPKLRTFRLQIRDTGGRVKGKLHVFASPCRRRRPKLRSHSEIGINLPFWCQPFHGNGIFCASRPLRSGQRHDSVGRILGASSSPHLTGRRIKAEPCLMTGRWLPCSDNLWNGGLGGRCIYLSMSSWVNVESI